MTPRLPRRSLLRRFRDDRSGGVAILIGLLGVVLIGFTAIGLDGASLFLAKRRQQAATDMAAIAAASALDQASTRIAAMMAANGYASAALDVVTGGYAADATLAPSQRFTPAVGRNAVRVTATTTQPLIFGSALQRLVGGPSQSTLSSGFPIRTQAVARKQDLAALRLGTSVASLDGGLLNAMLSALLGTQVSLGVLDGQALADARVNLFDFSDALATRVQASGPNYAALAAAATTMPALFASLADALNTSPRAAAAVRAIAASVPTTAAPPLSRLIDFGPAGGLSVGAPRPLSASVSGLDLLSALVRLCNGGRVATLNLGATLPGLANVQVALAVGEPSQGSGYFAVGPEATVLHAAQVRLQITAEVGGAGLPAAMTVPLYLEVAPASATVTAVACNDGATNAGVTLGVATGLASAALGTVQPSDMANLSASPPVTAATLLNVAGLLRANGTAQASLANASPVAVAFTADDIRAGTQRTVSTTPSLASLLTGLAANTRITVSVLGLTPPQPALSAALQAALAAAMAPLDAALERLLTLLGVSVGTATTSVTGVRCGQGQLVN